VLYRLVQRRKYPQISEGNSIVNSSPETPNPQQSGDALRVLNGAKYMNLETYRRNGVGVRTPVWFAALPAASSDGEVPKYYVYAEANSGKAKRVRRGGFVRIAACDVRGNVTSPWTDALAQIVTGTEFALGMRLLDRKYFPWKQLLNLSAALFRRRERVVLAIQPVQADASTGGTVSR
jgi:PPOX class probable F420-dependent enzyme